MPDIQDTQVVVPGFCTWMSSTKPVGGASIAQVTVNGTFTEPVDGLSGTTLMLEVWPVVESITE